MPTARVTDDGNVGEIEMVRRNELREIIDRRGHIGQRSGIAAVVFADTAVFDIPDGIPSGDEVGCHRIFQIEAVAGPPETAVDEDDDRQSVLTGTDSFAAAVGSESSPPCEGSVP